LPGWGLIAAGALVGVATYLTFTRSAMPAIACGLAAIALFMPLEHRLRVWAALAAAAILFIVLQGTGVIGARYYADASSDDSAASHLALLEVGTAIALDNPLSGIGHTRFEDVSVGYAGIVSAAARVTGGQSTLGYLPPHNDFLMVWISWGLLALAAYFAIFLGALANCVHVALSTRDGLVRGAAVGTLGALISYAVNSAFHNYLDSSLLFWMCAGLSVALARLPTTPEGALARVRWRNYAMVRGLYAYSHPGDRR
jgi:O-antigen ligase